MPSAYLFDAYPHPRRSALVVWIKHGRRVTKRIVPYQPHFCVKAEEESLERAEELMAKDPRVDKVWRGERRLWLRHDPEPVLNIRPKRLQDLFSVATDLRRDTHSKGFLFFDVDNQPESRWMHEQGLWTMCRLQTRAGQAVLELAEAEDRWTVDYHDPQLVTTHLAVHVDVQGTEKDFADPLVAINLDGTVFVCTVPGDDDSEREMLRAFGDHLRRLDPDIIFTKHGDRFDIPYILRRLAALGLDHTIWLGRDPDPQAESPDQQSKSIHTYGRWLFKTHAYYLRGRWHIDLSKKTLDSEDDRKDIHGILYLARISNRRAQDVNRNGAGYALQQMQIDEAVSMGVALPWKRNLAEDWKDAATLCAVDRGGQIMVPVPGVYDDVAACDFSGYYPSLVVRHNLSSDTINCACCPDAPFIPELNYHVCQRNQGHQSGILKRLAPHRKWAKAVLKKANHAQTDPGLVEKAKAIKSEHKAIGVVCFGYFRYRNARFGCAEVHQAIQCYGRDGMTKARDVALSRGFTMVHALTDCVFLQKPGITRAECLSLLRGVQEDVKVPMDLEGVYKWIVLLPSKVHSRSAPGAVGVPNRYYGKFTDGTLKVRGIEVQRHSTPEWIYDVQQGMLDVLGEADDGAGFLARIPRALDVAQQAAHDLRNRLVDPKHLGTMVQATKEVEQYRAETNTKHALRRLRDAGTERKPGEYVKYVVTRTDGPKPARVVPIELFDQGGWFGPPNVAYHVEHYLRLLARSIETLLAPFGYSEDNVLAWLAGRAPMPLPVNPKPMVVPERAEWVR